MTFRPSLDALASLEDLISSISEECYCAGWLVEIEFWLWEIVSSGASDDVPFGQYWVLASELVILRELSDRIGGWISWSDASRSVEFVKMEEWLAKYDLWMKQREAVHA